MSYTSTKVTDTQHPWWGSGQIHIPLIFDKDLCPQMECETAAESHEEKASVPWKRRLKVALQQARLYGEEKEAHRVRAQQRKMHRRMRTGVFNMNMRPGAPLKPLVRKN